MSQNRKRIGDEKNWSEVYGKFQRVIEEGEYIVLDIEGLPPRAYNSDSQEANIIREELENVEPGTTIGILKTDIPAKPIVVRTEENSSQEGDDS